MSPLSLLTALTMLWVGTRNNSSSQLKSALHLPSEVQQSTVNDYYHTFMSGLEAKMQSIRQEKAEYAARYPGGLEEILTSQENVMLVKNVALLSNELNILPEYESIVKDKYLAKIDRVNFESEGEQIKDSINRWANETTDGYIPSMLTTPPDAASALVILNAVFFQAIWKRTFKGPVEEGPFYPSEGENKTARYMRQDDVYNFWQIPYGEEASEDLMMIELPYRPNNANMSMLVFFPPESKSVNSLIAEKSLIDLAEQFMINATSQKVKLRMPKFKFTSKLDMKSYLKQMGVVDIFAPSTADLSGISSDPRLFLSKALHATAIEVDKQGTKAAALTYMEIMLSSARIIRPVVELTLNRPFAFIIYDKKNKLPIFVGKLGDASA